MKPAFLLVVLAVALPACVAFAEVSDKVGESREGHWIVTCALLLLTAIAAASGWRRALLIWPVTLLWGMIAFGTVREWRDEIQQEGTTHLLWEGAITAAAMLLCPPLFAGLAQRRQRTSAL